MEFKNVNFLTFFIILHCVARFAFAVPEEPQFTYYNLYDAGKSAYREERWYECAAFMRRALEDYKFYRGIIWDCHKRCDRSIPTDPFPIDTPAFGDEKKAIFGNDAVPEVRILEKFVKKALCLRRCKYDRLPGRPIEGPNEVVEKEFRQLQPYSYAQFCFWKLGDLEHAVSAAYTFLTRNPGDKMMSENLAYYMNEKSFSDSMVKDLELPEYQASYLDGVKAYDEQRYIDVIDKMERSLEAYFEEYEKCRSHCDSMANSETAMSLDFYAAVAVSYIEILRCRSQCESDMTLVRGNRMDDFVPSHFHYLQYAYWKESKIRKTAEAVSTFQLFYPEDESMTHNKRYYLENFNLKLDHFVPRLEIVRYYKRLLLEKRLLEFLVEKFPSDGEEPAKYHPDDYRDIPDDIPGMDDAEFNDVQQRKSKESADPIPKVDSSLMTSLPPAPLHNRKGDDGMIMPDMEVASPFWAPSSELLDKYETAHGVKVIKKEKELSGRYRFLADKLLSTEECQSLLQLAKLAEFGDGYDGQVSPHTKHEIFSGLTVVRVAELAAEGKASTDSAKLLLDKSEQARDLVQTYFNLTTHLYFDYTHLVCRSAKESGEDAGGPALLRSDLSHAIHGDNCVFMDGRCDRRFPAYTWRDYSAVIYLNDDFSGGEFIFSDKNKAVEAEIAPKCGQMVGFSADTLHGVRAISQGSRCVIALWLTLDSSHEEKERIRAQQMLAEIELAKDDEVALDPSTASHYGEL